METFKSYFTGRPVWMNAIMVFCAYMTFIYMPFDLFYKPVDQDAEVWFGYMLHGWAAKATEPLHWAIYGAGFYGFLKMKSWMFPWASLYVFQVAIGMVVWPLLYKGTPPLIGVAIGIPFVILGVMLWRAKNEFSDVDADAKLVVDASEVVDAETSVMIEAADKENRESTDG
jgi:nitrogen fixation-related uncharacterized protein